MKDALRAGRTKIDLVEFLRQQAVHGSGPAHKLKCAAAEACHDGVTCTAGLACSRTCTALAHTVSAYTVGKIGSLKAFT